MLIWLGVVETVLALTGMAAVIVLYILMLRVHELTVMLQRTELAFSEALKKEADGLCQHVDSFLKHTDDSLEEHSGHISTSNKEVLAGAKALRESWESLSTEIRTRYENYDKAQRLALRQIQAVEYLDKLIRSMGGKTRKAVSDNISTPSEADAAAMEELTEAERQVLVNTASGLNRNDDDF